MASGPETKLVGKMLKRLNGMDGCEARKVHGSQFSRGEPDIDAVLWGVPLKAEVKVPGKGKASDPTPLQDARLRAWERAGAVTGCVRSMEELEALIERCSRRGRTEWPT